MSLKYLEHFSQEFCLCHNLELLIPTLHVSKAIISSVFEETRPTIFPQTSQDKRLAWGPKYQQSMWTTGWLQRGVISAPACRIRGQRLDKLRPGAPRDDRKENERTCVVWSRRQGADCVGMSNGMLSLAETPDRAGWLVTKNVCVSVTAVIREEGFNKRPTGTWSAEFRETVSNQIKRHEVKWTVMGSKLCNFSLF